MTFDEAAYKLMSRGQRRGQAIDNIFAWIRSEFGKDPFYVENDELDKLAEMYCTSFGIF